MHVPRCASVNVRPGNYLRIVRMANMSKHGRTLEWTGVEGHGQREYGYACNGCGVMSRDESDPCAPCLRDELAKLASEGTMVMPSRLTIEIIEPTGDAFKLYQEQIELADRAINLAIMGSMFIDGNRYVNAADVINAKFETAP